MVLRRAHVPFPHFRPQGPHCMHPTSAVMQAYFDPPQTIPCGVSARPEVPLTCTRYLEYSMRYSHRGIDVTMLCYILFCPSELKSESQRSILFAAQMNQGDLSYCLPRVLRRIHVPSPSFSGKGPGGMTPNLYDSNVFLTLNPVG